MEAKLSRMGVKQLVSPEWFSKDIDHLLSSRDRLIDPRALCGTLLTAALDADSFIQRVESEILPMMGSPRVHPARELAALTMHVVACCFSNEPDMCMSHLERLNARLVELAISKGWSATASVPRDAECTCYPVMGTQHPKESVLAYREQ